MGRWTRPAAAVYSGAANPPSAGANSTLLSEEDGGSWAWTFVRETTAGQGSRPVGVTAAKDWWHAHLKVKTPGPGYVHLASDLPDEWYQQMTSEQRILARTARGTRYVWVKESGKRNEAWDCSVYALFAAHALDLHRYTDAMWRRLRDRIAPVQRDLLDEPIPAAAAVSHETPAAPARDVPPESAVSESTPAPAPAKTGSAAAPRDFGGDAWNERF
jgi:phage terminase large subunit GpA-like protein